MSAWDEFTEGLSPQEGESSLVEAEETELSYELQNYQAGDRALVERIVHYTFSDLYRWVRVLLYYRQRSEPEQAEILTILPSLYTHAFNHLDEFHNQSSIHGWLFNIGLNMVGKKKGKVRQEKVHQSGDAHEDPPGLIHHPWGDSSDIFDRLPEKLLQPLLLRYLFDQDLAGIACGLGIQEKAAFARMVDGRRRIFRDLPMIHMDRSIQAYLEGILDHDPVQFDQVNQHLQQCADCQAYVSELSQLEKATKTELQQRWRSPRLDEAELKTLADKIFQQINLPQKNHNIGFPVRQAVIIAAMLVVFSALAVLFVRLTPEEQPLPAVSASSTPDLPAVIENQSTIPISREAGLAGAESQYIIPRFSSDGSWGVLADIQMDPVTGAVLPPTVALLDRRTNSLQVISKKSARMSFPWVWWDLAPSISSDGRWIVYTGETSDPSVSGNGCLIASQHNCLDIFLFDRQTGITKRITQGMDGAAANDHSFSPTISADGMWVAYWSVASNLEADIDAPCRQSGVAIMCLYIHLYNRETGKTQRVPGAQFPGDNVFGMDRISLSADGRYVGFTATSWLPGAEIFTANQPTDSTLTALQNGQVMGLLSLDSTHRQEAVVYDQVTGKFELQNVRQDGTLGSGDSLSPVLSADGKFVAFISSSNNLVHENTRNIDNVFLRNRTTGEIFMVSRSVDVQGKQDNGVGPGGIEYYSLDISADGRYVVFKSRAADLVPNGSSACLQGGVSSCDFLYVYDQQMGSIKLISGLTNPEYTLFPQLAPDGSWIVYMQAGQGCAYLRYVCSKIEWYDPHSGLIRDLTHSEDALAQLAWPEAGRLQLPWQMWESQALTFSSDGRLLALGGMDSSIRLWQLPDNKNPLPQLPFLVLHSDGNDPIAAAVFNPAGTWLAAGTITGNVELWSIPEGKLLYQLKDQAGLIKTMRFSADGSELIVSTLNKAWIWKISHRNLVQVGSFSYSAPTYSIDISPKGDLLASARGDGTVWLHSLPDGKVVARLGGSQSPKTDQAFSEDGSLLAVRSMRGDIAIWRLEKDSQSKWTADPLISFEASGNTGALIFSPDDQYLASAGYYGGILVWNMREGVLYQIARTAPVGMIYTMTFSNQGNKLAVESQGEILLLDVKSEIDSGSIPH